MKVNIQSILQRCRDLNIQVNGDTTYKLDLMCERLLQRKIRLRQYFDLAFDYVLKNCETPTLEDVIDVFKRSKTCREYLKGIDEESEELNKKWEMMIEDLKL